jgi:protein arginine kinase activator
MLCEKCGKNRAEIHFIRVINGEKVQEHWCRECAAKLMPFDEALKMMKMTFSADGAMDIQKALDEFVKPFLSGDAPGPSITCPHCGEDIDIKKLWQEFMEDAQSAAEAGGENPLFADFGKLLEDAASAQHQEQTFEEVPEEDMITEIDQDTAFSEPAEQKEPEDPKLKELADLKKQLGVLVHWEKYERAAQVRDRIRELEKSIQGI